MVDREVVALVIQKALRDWRARRHMLIMRMDAGVPVLGLARRCLVGIDGDLVLL